MVRCWSWDSTSLRSRERRVGGGATRWREGVSSEYFLLDRTGEIAHALTSK